MRVSHSPMEERIAMQTDTDPVVGVIGLGSMGGCLARRLLAAGRRVIGYDPAAPSADDLHRRGRRPGGRCRGRRRARRHPAPHLANRRELSATVVTTLAAHPKQGWVLDIDTLLPAEKIAARDRLAPAGWTMLDCTISGTPEMVAVDTHSFYVSGDRSGRAGGARDWSIRSRSRRSTWANSAMPRLIKLIINHMVIAHNVVAAEAMSLAVHAGMDPAQVYETVAASAGSSRIFELRGRMMVTEDYPDATMYALIVDKDATLIADMARASPPSHPDVRHRRPAACPRHGAGLGGQGSGLAGIDDGTARRRRPS